MLLSLALTLQSALSPAPAASPAGPGTDIHSRHFAVRSEAGKGVAVVALESGSPTRAEMALADERAVFGPGAWFALLGPPRNGLSDLQLLDRRFELLSVSSIATDLEPVLGHVGFALRRRSEHAVGTALAIEFRDARGRTLERQMRAERVLLRLEALIDGRWAAASVDPHGRFHVDLFDARGAFQWEADMGGAACPVVATTSDGARTAVGVLEEELDRSRLELFDAAGKVVTSRVVPAFRLARFSPDGEVLALLGGTTLSLVRSADGRSLYTGDEAEPFLLGAAMAFSADGSTLRALGWRPGSANNVGEDGAGGELTLLELNDLSSLPRVARRALAAPTHDRREVLDLFEQTAGSWLLVTQDGIQPLSR